MARCTFRKQPVSKDSVGIACVQRTPDAHELLRRLNVAVVLIPCQRGEVAHCSPKVKTLWLRR